MAKTDEQKPKFPNRPCPKCGKPIHIKSRKHPECGWGVEETTSAAPAPAPAAAKRGRPAKKQPAGGAASGGITLEDISAVKALVQRMGAEKVQQLAAVLAK